MSGSGLLAVSVGGLVEPAVCGLGLLAVPVGGLVEPAAGVTAPGYRKPQSIGGWLVGFPLTSDF